MAAILSALETVSYRHGGYAVPSSHILDHDEDVGIGTQVEVMVVVPKPRSETSFSQFSNTKCGY